MGRVRKALRAPVFRSIPWVLFGAVFIPAVLTVCARMGESPSKFLMPISFASMLGGSCTLIGTSSNILVSSLSEEDLEGVAAPVWCLGNENSAAAAPRDFTLDQKPREGLTRAG